MYLVHVTNKRFLYNSAKHSCISSVFETAAVPLITKLVVTPELYSTKHRVVGLACANVLSRTGGESVVALSNTLAESQTYFNTRKTN